MFRVTSLAMQTIALSNIAMLQSRVAENSIAISTGKTAQRFSGIPENAGRLVDTEALHAGLDQYIKNNQLTDTRLQAMETSVSQIFDIATEFRKMMTQALNSGNAENMPIGVTAQNMLDQVASLLNVEQNGRYLFAGTKTNTAPVNLNAAGFNPPGTVYPSTADTGYYQGDTTKLVARASESLNVTYGVTANEQGFEELIRALHIAANTTTSPVADTIRLGEAMRLAVEAIDNIPPIISNIGSARATLERANASHDDQMLYAEQTIGEIENVDIAKAITLLTTDQTTLEASFATLVRMQRMSLLDFL